MAKLRLSDSISTEGKSNFQVVVAANFTSDFIEPGLKFWLHELQINGHVLFSPYNQILQELINPNSLLSSNVNGVSVLFVRISDWLREFDQSNIQSEESVKSFLDSTANEFVNALKTHRSHCKVETLLCFCPYPKSLKPDWSRLLEEKQSFLMEAVSDLPGLSVINSVDYHRIYNIDQDQIHDPLREKIGHIPYQKSYFHFLSTLVIRHAYRKMLPICKVVVVDCDNTLWKGVVGEVGADGLTFEASHLALQRKLMQLSQSGVVISLCSKNEPFDVWSVFDNRNDFLLKRDCIVSEMINWQPKSENIKGLSNKINLGLDNFIFIDDNPVECAEVTAACPEVLTIQWPQDSDKASKLLDHIWEMDLKKGTVVDQKRTQMYKEELKRQEFMEEKVDFTEFLKSLELKTDLRDLNDEDLPRASQLTMRTNQFNFTTRRRKEGELKALMSDSNIIMQTVRVSDRFGDYGLVGFYIGEIKDDELIVDTFLLSCRVLGRGVEHYMLNELGRFASKKNIDTVRLEIFPTPRNTPARDFLMSASPEDCIEIFENNEIKSVIPSEILKQIELIHTSEEKIPKEDIQAAQNLTVEKQPQTEQEKKSREDQIKRAAYDLSDMISLGFLIDGKPSGKTILKGKADQGIDKEEISRFVYNVFSQELKQPIDTLKNVDLLEDLECDSFKIVEITVLLIERYPWLPETLLFEHRSISDIVADIQSLGKEGTSSFSRIEDSLIQSKDPAESFHDIAIIGYSLKCSGGETGEELWELLSNSDSAIRKVRADRPHFLDKMDETQSNWAGLLDDVDKFDAEFFKITPREAVLTDPQTRIMLETAWRAIEVAGYSGEDLDINTGVYMGVMYSDYVHLANQVANSDNSIYRSWEPFSVANRLSHFMGFRGPSFTVDTACSASGTALHLACKALENQECNMAVVGGVNLILNPKRFSQLSRLGITSSTGRCRPFCDDSNGVLFGEGAGVVVLKPLSQAHKDKDQIHGVIKGSALSSGTGSIGFTAPNPSAQSIAISKCIRDARIDPRTVSYIEAHGTGTALGDPIEVRGLTLSYGNKDLWDQNIEGEQNCTIGSIKPNIGHLESAAGVFGLIKVLLQFEKKLIAPSITSGKLNSKIPFDTIPFDVQQQLTTWKRPAFLVDGKRKEFPRRAGVSSFGVGGANAHIILEEPGSFHEDRSKAAESSQAFQVFTISAGNKTSLLQMAEFTSKFFDSNPEISLLNAAYSAGSKRKHFKSRAAFVVQDIKSLSEKVAKFSKGDVPPNCFTINPDKSVSNGKTAFLFTGQGAQYAFMGHDIYSSHPVFKSAMDKCAAILDQWLDVPFYDVLLAEENSEYAGLIDQTQYTQVALFSVEYALSRLWLHWGVKPDYVAGHSAGEIIALTSAGMLTLEDGLKLIFARGKIMQAIPPGGKMAAVRLNEDQVRSYLNGFDASVSIASINGPQQVVISGEGEVVDKIINQMDSDKIDYKYLNVSHAFHSPMMEPMLDEYLAVVENLTLGSPEFPVVSCVDGNIIEVESLTPKYWRDQVREAVRFMDAINLMDEKKVVNYIEIGPHPILLGMGRVCLPHDENNWLPSLRKNVSGWQTICESLAKLYVCGHTIDWKQYYQHNCCRKVNLPGYQFRRDSHWLKTEAVTILSNKEKVETADYLYSLVWEEQLITIQDTPSAEGQTWLIVSEKENDPVGQVLSETMGNSGGNLIHVFSGPMFKKRSHTQYSLRPDSAKDLDHLLLDISKKHESIQGVVVLWSDTDQSLSEDEVKGLGHGQHLFPLILSLIRAGHDSKILNQSKLWFLTRQAAAVSEDTSVTQLQADQSMLWGFGRGVSLEHPDGFGGLIDLAGEFDLSTGADQLISILLDPAQEDQICLGKNRTWVPRLVPEQTNIESGYKFAEDGVYLITGGLGALGKKVAEWMVSCGAKNIILTGRKGIDTPGAAQLSEQLQQKGTHVRIVALDIADEPSVSDFFNELSLNNASLKGVFHLAGIDQPKSLMDMDMNDISLVLSPKVDGTRLLHQHTLNFDLDLFVCFSSISAVLGSENRSHYGAANAFIDGLMAFRRSNGMPGLNINWGPWDQGGMASEEDVQIYNKIGNFALDPKNAVKILEHLICTGSSHKVVANIDWSVFSLVFEARRNRPMIQPCKSDAATIVRGSEKDVPPWIEKLADLSEQEKATAVINLLVKEISQLLGYDGDKDLPLEDDFSSIGIDSLTAVELSISIQKKLGLKNPLVIYDYPNITILANKLVTIASEEPTQGQLIEKHQAENQVTEYDVTQENSILKFFNKAWPDRDKELIEPRWRWMYIESAQRFGIDPMMWSYFESDTVIGFTGGIPVKIHVDGVDLASAWFVDTMILESCRDKGLGPRIMMKCKEDVPLNLSLGQTQEMRSILFKLGWIKIAPLQTYVFPLRPGRILKGKMNPFLASTASIGLQFYTYAKKMQSKTKLIKLDMRHVDRFGEQHDLLWEKVKQDYKCAVVRDASYLNWKYVDQPGQKFTRLELSKDGLIVAVGIIVLREPWPESVYKYRRAFIVDLIVSNSNGAILMSVLDAIRKTSVDLKADSLIFEIINEKIETALETFGFLKRDPERFFLIHPGNLKGQAVSEIVKPVNWLITKGDSDIDRPEGGIK